jgi:hypothetical protein
MAIDCDVAQFGTLASFSKLETEEMSKIFEDAGFNSGMSIVVGFVAGNDSWLTILDNHRKSCECVARLKWNENCTGFPDG